MPFRFNPCKPCCISPSGLDTGCVYNVSIFSFVEDYQNIFVNGTSLPSGSGIYTFQGSGNNLYNIAYDNPNCINTTLGVSVQNVGSGTIYVNDIETRVGNTQGVMLGAGPNCSTPCSTDFGLLDIECSRPPCSCIDGNVFLWMLGFSDGTNFNYQIVPLSQSSGCYYYSSPFGFNDTFSHTNTGPYVAFASSRDYPNSILGLIASGDYNVSDFANTYDTHARSVQSGGFNMDGQTDITLNQYSCSPCLYTPIIANNANVPASRFFLSYSNTDYVYPYSLCGACLSVPKTLIFDLKEITFFYCPVVSDILFFGCPDDCSQTMDFALISGGGISLGLELKGISYGPTDVTPLWSFVPAIPITVAQADVQAHAPPLFCSGTDSATITWQITGVFVSLDGCSFSVVIHYIAILDVPAIGFHDAIGQNGFTTVPMAFEAPLAAKGVADGLEVSCSPFDLSFDGAPQGVNNKVWVYKMSFEVTP